MGTTPSVLIVDDGELDRVHQALVRLGADQVRLKGHEIGPSIVAPRDVLISSGRRTREMPEITRADGQSRDPAWVCVHNQDFLPLRERLRELGVNYLLHHALDTNSLERFLLQLLHVGRERRESLRLPLGARVTCLVDERRERATLADLAVDSGRLLSTRGFDVGAEVRVLLPTALGGDGELELHGRALRTAECEAAGGEPAHATVLQWIDLADETRSQLMGIVSGEQIGTRITPLAPVSPPARTEADDRRRHSRVVYDRPVGALEFLGAGRTPVLGQDLSARGLRVRGQLPVEIGTNLNVILYGAAREEPMVVAATVVRREDDEIALRFDRVSRELKKKIELLSRSLPALERLDGPDGEDRRVVVSELTSAG